MVFEGKDFRVILPLDPSQGERYTEPIYHNDQADVKLVSPITAQDEGTAESPAAGWESGSSCMTDPEGELENWQHRLSELHQDSNACLTKSIRWVDSQTRHIPVYDGSTDPALFIAHISAQIPAPQIMDVLESAFRATAIRWWSSHKKQIPTWDVCQTLLRLRFSDQLTTVRSKFDGKTCP